MLLWLSDVLRLNGTCCQSKISGSVERPGDINEYAYINGGTWWLGNWVTGLRTRMPSKENIRI